jgi:glycosyltransferase involved in cell wall biosynthesis
MGSRSVRLKHALEAVDVFLAPTRFARERALEAGIPAQRVEVAPLGAVDGPPQARGDGPRRRLAFVGSVLPHKGVHVLVEAFRGLDGDGLRLDVHGSLALDPGYAAALRRTAAGDRRIRLRGPFPEGGQATVLSETDVLVAPSVWWENSPLTVLEALAAGVPVVASAIGGVPELVEDGVSGILVPPGDVAALGAALADVTGGRRLAGRLAALRIRTAAEEARELEARYASLLAARPTAGRLDSAG